MRPFAVTLAFFALGFAGAACAAESALPMARLATGDVRSEPVQLAVSGLLAWALFPPILFWCGLAARRAWVSDIAGPQRRSRRALLQLTDTLCARETAPTSAELLAWRRHVCEFWQVSAAVPSGGEITVLANAEWGKLWEETEHALFSRDGGLPADWVTRATLARREVEQVTLPSRMPWRVRHWLPVAAGLILAAMPGPVRADEPRDWAHRHNTALALAQEGKWDAAHAHWTAAFLLNPRAEAVRSGWRESFGRVGGADPRLRQMIEGAWYKRMVSWGAATEWARVAQACAGAFTVVTCGWLALAYAGRERRCRIVLAVLATGAVGGAVAGIAAFRFYGALTNPQAACIATIADVRPAPSDVVARQQAVTLLPGTMVVVDRSFLGWDHIVSADGKFDGWLRSETAVWIYRVRDNSRVSRSYVNPPAE